MENINDSQSITEDEALAREIAIGLNDAKNVKLFHRFCMEYTHESLIELLKQVQNIPDKNIKKSRGALFTYLVKQDARKKIKQEVH